MPAISHQHGLSEGLQIDRGLLAAAAVGLHLIGDLLTLHEAAQAGALTALMWTNTSLPPASG